MKHRFHDVHIAFEHGRRQEAVPGDRLKHRFLDLAQPSNWSARRQNMISRARPPAEAFLSGRRQNGNWAGQKTVIVFAGNLTP